MTDAEKTQKQHRKHKTANRRVFLVAAPAFLVGLAAGTASSKAKAFGVWPPPTPTYLDYIQSFMQGMKDKLVKAIENLIDSVGRVEENYTPYKQAANGKVTDAKIMADRDLHNARVGRITKPSPSKCAEYSVAKDSISRDTVVEARSAASLQSNADAVLANMSSAIDFNLHRVSMYLDAPDDSSRYLQTSAVHFCGRRGYTDEGAANAFMENLKGTAFFHRIAPTATGRSPQRAIEYSVFHTWIARLQLVEAALQEIFTARVKSRAPIEGLSQSIQTAHEGRLVRQMIETGGASQIDLLRFEVDRTTSSEAENSWSYQVDDLSHEVPLLRETLTQSVLKNSIESRKRKVHELTNLIEGVLLLETLTPSKSRGSDNG